MALTDVELLTPTLDVINKYRELLSMSLGANGVYIRTKETLDDLLATGDMTGREKSQVLSDVLTSLNSALVANSMSVAVRWAEKEKDIILAREETLAKINSINTQIALSAAQEKKMFYDTVQTQAETERVYGTPTVVDGVLQSLTDTGKLYQDIQISKQQAINLGKEAVLLDSKLNESYVAIHKVVADTYVNNGNFTYGIGPDGVTAVNNITPTTHTPLSKIQAEIAKGQANGYAWNGWANALTATSSMLGTAIAGDLTDFGPGTKGDSLLASSMNLVTKFSHINAPY